MKTQPKKVKKTNFSRFSLYLIIIVLFIAAFFLFKKITSGGASKMQTETIPNVVKKVLGSDTAKITISNLKKVSGVYEFDLTINGQKYHSFISADGKILFPSGQKIEELKTQATQTEAKKLTCQDVTKSKTPSLTAFVVSNCPFGLQMQRVFNKAITEQSELGSYLNIKYIGSIENGKIVSMHGDVEAQENLKQICIREEQKEKYWPYVACYMQEGKSDECNTTAGIDTVQLNTCTSDNNLGLKYAKADFDLANRFQVSGSPSLLMNNKQIVSEFDFGGRNPNAIKQLVCCGSSEKAAFCSNEISKTDVAVSLSLTDDAVPNSETTTGSAGCAPAK